MASGAGNGARKMKILAGAIVTLILGNFIACPAYADCTPSNDEQAIWDAIKNSDNPGDFFAYLNQYPNGCFRPVAKFRFAALVPPKMPIIIRTLWGESSDSVWIQHVNGAATNQINLRSTYDQQKMRLQYRCDAGGVGLTGWYDDGQTCPTPPRDLIQGFSVRMLGPWAPYYDLTLECGTHMYNNADERQFIAHDGEWCGNHAGDGQRWVYRFRLSITRKVFN